MTNFPKQAIDSWINALAAGIGEALSASTANTCGVCEQSETFLQSKMIGIKEAFARSIMIDVQENQRATLLRMWALVTGTWGITISIFETPVQSIARLYHPPQNTRDPAPAHDQSP